MVCVPEIAKRYNTSKVLSWYDGQEGHEKNRKTLQSTEPKVSTLLRESAQTIREKLWLLTTDTCCRCRDNNVGAYRRFYNSCLLLGDASHMKQRYL